VLITGFQAEGTLGRELVNGSKSVRIRGEEFRVEAPVHTIGGLSAHGDQQDMLRWLKGFDSSPHVYVVHGENGVKEVFSTLIQEQLGLETSVPQEGDRVLL